MTIILFQKAIRCKVMQSTSLLFKWTYNEHSWICCSKLQVRLEKSGMLFYPSFRSRVPHSSSESWFMSWVITWCFCMLSVLSICSIWLRFKKAIPWLPQDDYDKLALQYLSYARCLILDTFLWLSEWWTVITFLHFAKILVPIVLVYSIYSLKFECHKGIVASLGWSFHRQIIHQWPLDSEKSRPNASKARLQTARYLLHVSASMVYALGFALMYLGMFSPSCAIGECQRNQIWWHDDMIAVPRWPHRTPQLFINYRMKSVAYLPWKRFIYSFLFEFQACESQDVPCKQTCFCQYQVHVHLTESKGQSTRSLTLGSKTGRWSIWAVQTCHPEFLFVFLSNTMSLKLAWRMTSFPSSSRCRPCTAGPWECNGWLAIGGRKGLRL